MDKRINLHGALRGLKWGNKTDKLKRSIEGRMAGR